MIRDLLKSAALEFMHGALYVLLTLGLGAWLL